MNLLSACSRAAVAFGIINPWYGLSPNVCETVSFLGAIVLVTLGLLLWARFVRKRRRHHSHHQHSSPQARRPSGQSDEAAEGHQHHHGRRRRRRHRPRNPTLAETGGLPPRRTREPHETAA